MRCALVIEDDAKDMLQKDFLKNPQKLYKLVYVSLKLIMESYPGRQKAANLSIPIRV